MADWVGLAATRRARVTNLYDFLLSEHPREVLQEGDSLRLCCNHSVSIRKGYAGYTDFADWSTGNAIECLTNFLGYDFTRAVTALALFDGMPEEELTAEPEERELDGGYIKLHSYKEIAEDGDPFQCLPRGPSKQGAPGPSVRSSPSPSSAPAPPAPAIQPPRVFNPPAPIQGYYARLVNYLSTQRGFPADMIKILVDDKILYQEASHNNLVFIDPAWTFAELRGSYTGKPFHQVMFSDPAAFWWFNPRGPYSNDTVRKAYVCEGAIDAVSLYLYLLSDDANAAETAIYCSIAGVSNQQRIDRIKSGMAAAGCPVILAVDNDKAGQLCRERNPDCQAYIPWNGKKDWNEVLLACERDTSLNAPHRDITWLGTQARLNRDGYDRRRA